MRLSTQVSLGWVDLATCCFLPTACTCSDKGSSACISFSRSGRAWSRRDRADGADAAALVVSVPDDRLSLLTETTEEHLHSQAVARGGSSLVHHTRCHAHLFLWSLSHRRRAKARQVSIGRSSCASSCRQPCRVPMVTESESLGGSAAAALDLLANASLLVPDDPCRRCGHVQR
jgi:hypothetical protein